MYYFRIVTTYTNKYRPDHPKNEKCGGIKLRNITVQEKLRLYGAMIWISIKPRHIE